MSTPTTTATPTVEHLRALVGVGQREAKKTVRASFPKVAWYRGGPNHQLHAVARWRPGRSGYIEALCGAASWGWSEAEAGTARPQCSECATKAFDLPRLNPSS